MKITSADKLCAGWQSAFSQVIEDWLPSFPLKFKQPVFVIAFPSSCFSEPQAVNASAPGELKYCLISFFNLPVSALLLSN